MKVVIDDNIIIDALKPNAEFEADALKILRLASEDKFDGCVCANSLTNIFYVVNKAHGAEYAKSKLKGLMGFTTAIGLTEEDCADALDLPMNDFEDAVVAVCAKKAGADCIVSRDDKFVRAEAEVEAITPSRLLARIK